MGASEVGDRAGFMGLRAGEFDGALHEVALRVFPPSPVCRCSACRRNEMRAALGLDGAVPWPAFMARPALAHVHTEHAERSLLVRHAGPAADRWAATGASGLAGTIAGRLCARAELRGVLAECEQGLRRLFTACAAADMHFPNGPPIGHMHISSAGMRAAAARTSRTWPRWRRIGRPSSRASDGRSCA